MSPPGGVKVAGDGWAGDDVPAKVETPIARWCGRHRHARGSIRVALLPEVRRMEAVETDGGDETRVRRDRRALRRQWVLSRCAPMGAEPSEASRDLRRLQRGHPPVSPDSRGFSMLARTPSSSQDLRQ